MHDTNGTQEVRPAQTLAEAREAHKIAKYQRSAAILRAETNMLREGYYAGPGSSYTGNAWGDFVDPRDAYRDGDRWIFGPKGIYERRDGNSMFFFTQQELNMARSAARWLAGRNTVALGIVETICDFVVGDGILPTVGSKEKAPDMLIREVQNVLDEFVDATEFDEFQSELVSRVVVDGEAFIRYHVDEDGGLTIRSIEPEYIWRPLGAPFGEWSWGCRHYLDPEMGTEDIQRIISYALHHHESTYQETHPREMDDWEQVDGCEILHVKRNTTRTMKRGVSDFYGAGHGLDNVAKLINNMTTGEGIRQAIVGFYEHDLASADVVEKLRNQQQDQYQPYPVNPITGKTPHFQKYEPGTIVNTPKGRKFVGPPVSAGGANQGSQVIQAALRAMLVRWGMPEYFSGDASNAAFASTLVAGSPFVRRVKRWQAFFIRRFERVYWRAIRQAYESGRFGNGWSWEALQKLIDVQLEAPSPTLANELQEGQVDDMDLKNGVLSKQTRRKRRGLDNEQEQINLKQEPVQQAAPGVGPGQTGQWPQLSQGRVAGGQTEELRARVVRLIEVAEEKEKGPACGT